MRLFVSEVLNLIFSQLNLYVQLERLLGKRKRERGQNPRSLNERHYFVLERVFQRELNLAFRGIGAGDLAKSAIGDTLVWRPEADRIQNIEEVSAEFQITPLRNGKVLAGCHIEVFEARSTLRANASSSKARGRLCAISAN